jgi:hypothetical protein
MINGRVLVRDGVLHDALRVYGNDIFEILEKKKAEGFKIVLTDDLGQPYPNLSPNLGKGM